jgi:hypothetical protein
MTWLRRAAATATVLLATVSVAGADAWNDKTTMKFDAPVMVPGATLAPGTYTFKLMDSTTNRHMVQIFNEDQTKLMTTAMSVPTKRMDPSGDVVVKLNPTEAGAPAAIKAWFYPGSLYGHEFIYPDDQAKQIAQRTKQLVLSGEVGDSDMGKATLHTYDAEGRQAEWHGDARVIKEWQQWVNDGGRTATARIATPGTPETRESTAPAVRATPDGQKVAVGELEENPAKYTGKTINVTAEVEEVFGPRLFKIDEPGWADLDGEVLVYLPADLAALVREDDRVTVTGTMATLTKVDLDRDLAWLDYAPDMEIRLTERPVLKATSIVGGNSDVALAIRVSPTQQASSGAAGSSENTAAGAASGTSGQSETADKPRATGESGAANTGTTGTSGRAGTNPGTGTSGTNGSGNPALTSLSEITRADRSIVGRRVDLNGVQVSRQAKGDGFWIQGGGASVFVLPPRPDAQPSVTQGQSVSIDGVVLEMPRRFRQKAEAVSNANDDIYVYATIVK